MIGTLKPIPKCEVEVNIASALHLASGMLPFPTRYSLWTLQPWCGCNATLTSYLKPLLCIESELRSLKSLQCCMTTCWPSLATQTVKDLPECRLRFSLWVRKVPWRRKQQPTPVSYLESPWTEEPGRYSLWGGRESDTTEQLTGYTVCPPVTSFPFRNVSNKVNVVYMGCEFSPSVTFDSL